MRKGIRILLGAALIATVASRADAAQIGSGPLRVADLESYTCAVVNIGTKPVDVDVVVTIDGGGGGATKKCAGLVPNDVCIAENDAGSSGYRFCTATASSKKSVRGTFCDVGTGLCVPVQ
ncbi:hypothetical protein K2Z84_08665 [Candidatus Binatia bacterium]|nr:hypothetical protein [Candidatus Binatia bacterium]